MTIYKMYGLFIDSEVDLHLPAAAGRNADVTVRLNKAMKRSLSRDDQRDHFEANYQRLFWPFAGSAEIFNGQDVVLTPFEDVDASIFSFAILGPVIAIILHAHGFLTLHASCAALNGKAVAFMGDKGAGKSTMTAAAIAAGYQLVADDIAALQRNGDADMCRHGYPLMKVSDASLHAFPGLTSQGGEVMQAPIGDKHLVRLPVQPENDIPITALFVLTRGDHAKVELLSLDDAYGSLMRFSYPIRFGTGVLKVTGSAEYAKYMAAIAGRIPVYMLTVAEGLHRTTEALALVAKAVANDQ